MAKFMIEGDTKTGEMKIMLEGQELTDIMYVCAEKYNYDGESKINFRAESMNTKDANGVRKHTSYYAKKADDTKTVIKEFDDIVQTEDKSTEQIHSFFAQLKKDK
jgi:hypothetical protein